MAVLAGDLFMFTPQLKISVFVMFELGTTPVPHGVTFFALFAVLAVVLVTAFMTRKAIGL